MISAKKQIEQMFNELPQGAKDAIERRDQKALSHKPEPEKSAG